MASVTSRLGGELRRTAKHFSKSWFLSSELWVLQLRPLGRVVPGRAAVAVEKAKSPQGTPVPSLLSSRAADIPIIPETAGSIFDRQVTLGL